MGQRPIFGKDNNLPRRWTRRSVEYHRDNWRATPKTRSARLVSSIVLIKFRFYLLISIVTTEEPKFLARDNLNNNAQVVYTHQNN